jgi:hypothetical protein
MMDVVAIRSVFDAESVKPGIVVRTVTTRRSFVVLVYWRSIGAFPYIESR